MTETLSQTQSVDLSEKQLREILDLAATGPSGDNCQPWEFVWNGRELSVFHNEERAQHALNVDNQASLIAFGCLLEIISLAARQQGLSSEIEYAPNVGSSSTDAWAKVSFRRGNSSEDAELASVLKQRCTDRREFQKGEFPKSLIDGIESDNRLFKRAQAYVCDSPSVELIECLAKSESQVLRWRRGFSDILKWVRFTEKETESSRDGMSWKNLGVRFHEALTLRFIRRFPSVLSVLRPALYPEYRRTIARKIKSSAGLVSIAVDGTEPAGLIEAGRLVIRTWLRLTASGFAVQPLTFSSLFIQFFRLRDAGKLNPLSEIGALEPLVEKGRAVIDKDFKIPSEMIPVWMFRAGRSPALPQELRALRREPTLKILP